MKSLFLLYTQHILYSRANWFPSDISIICFDISHIGLESVSLIWDDWLISADNNQILVHTGCNNQLLVQLYYYNLITQRFIPSSNDFSLNSVIAILLTVIAKSEFLAKWTLLWISLINPWYLSSSFACKIS